MKENAVRIFADGKNLRKLFSRGAGINRREAPTQLFQRFNFFYVSAPRKQSLKKLL